MPTTVSLHRSECEFEDGLPRVCMRCGSAAGGVVVRRFSLTRSMIVCVFLCSRHRRDFTHRAAGTTLLVALSLASLGAGLDQTSRLNWPKAQNEFVGPEFVAGTAAALVLCSAAYVVSNRGVMPVRIAGDEIRLKGVHEEFAAALKDQRRAERAERWGGQNEL